LPGKSACKFAVGLEIMAGVEFPNAGPDGSFCVEVVLSVSADGLALGREVQEWWTDVWAPSNAAWVRIWETGPGLSLERSELLYYQDEFVSPPRVVSRSASEFRFQLLGKDSARKLWKDWLVSRIMPDLKTRFPEIGNLLGISDCNP
jgi:hypothetical protein